MTIDAIVAVFVVFVLVFGGVAIGYRLGMRDARVVKAQHAASLDAMRGTYEQVAEKQKELASALNGRQNALDEQWAAMQRLMVLLDQRTAALDRRQQLLDQLEAR